MRRVHTAKYIDPKVLKNIYSRENERSEDFLSNHASWPCIFAHLSVTGSVKFASRCCKNFDATTIETNSHKEKNCLY